VNSTAAPYFNKTGNCILFQFFLNTQKVKKDFLTQADLIDRFCAPNPGFGKDEILYHEGPLSTKENGCESRKVTDPDQTFCFSSFKGWRLREPWTLTMEV
jgi:hypothetical protein